MALNINIVNSTIIEVYQDSNYPRYYFGALGTSGKFYPSGTSGALPYGVDYVANYCEVLLDTMDGDNSASNVPSFSNSGTGATFVVSVAPFIPTDFAIDNYAGTGYAIGDTITIEGSDVAPGITGQLILKITNVLTDGLLIVIGGDDYEVKWYDLVVGGTSPTSLSDAQSLLANLFSTL